ncbi:hypothetical protein [Halomonas cupida]|uniref:hypothetical protein n=1 Tax=Halomonas cupida TaxID=44933 RepID=UPI003A8DAF91
MNRNQSLVVAATIAFGMLSAGSLLAHDGDEGDIQGGGTHMLGDGNMMNGAGQDMMSGEEMHGQMMGMMGDMEEMQKNCNAMMSRTQQPAQDNTES